MGSYNALGCAGRKWSRPGLVQAMARWKAKHRAWCSATSMVLDHRPCFGWTVCWTSRTGKQRALTQTQTHTYTHAHSPSLHVFLAAPYTRTWVRWRSRFLSTIARRRSLAVPHWSSATSMISNCNENDHVRQQTNRRCKRS